MIPTAIKIGIVVGEDSGDLLGASLVRALKAQCDHLHVEGIIGPRLEAEGCQKLYSAERLSVMGIIEPLKRLPEILKIQNKVYRHFVENPPDVFIGIDAPDFNLSLERRLKKHQIKTVHYVSPTVWAWRKWRIYKIKKAVDLMLTVFPFEERFYHQYHVPAQFVGHPLADEIPLELDSTEIRQRLKIDQSKKVLAILPGSREMEIERLTEPFLETAAWCVTRYPELEIITAMVNEEREKQFSAIWQRVAPKLPIKVYRQQSHEVMAASDVLLLASGTVTLEAMLFKKPMVVAYRISPITFFLAKLLVRGLRHFSLPNLIAGEECVPEFLQDRVVPKKMGKEILDYLVNEARIEKLKNRFTSLHQSLRRNASHEAARAVLKLNIRD